MNSCSENCIETGRCDRFTGQCEGGCKSGWTGTTCANGKYHHFFSCVMHIYSTNHTLITLMNARYNKKKAFSCVRNIKKMITN